MFPPDFKELLSVFNSRKVRYLLKALYAALVEFGAPLEGVKAEDFMQPDAFFRMGARLGKANRY
jgi:hypothetical protein